jgi:hypothetical protein
MNVQYDGVLFSCQRDCDGDISAETSLRTGVVQCLQDPTAVHVPSETVDQRQSMHALNNLHLRKEEFLGIIAGPETLR